MTRVQANLSLTRVQACSKLTEASITKERICSKHDANSLQIIARTRTQYTTRRIELMTYRLVTVVIPLRQHIAGDGSFFSIDRSLLIILTLLDSFI
ncbi:hypothetical protein AVEN_152259-1 [Araneus ventricosus]|uniref:Uncharacterized protein n=1 Tax=Araneus ventricosus TaxID=182803 RepID=A0A4Y2H8N0_ARAVE|nr:hypothetical protein AVEN_152259-1 [Araneus ventricosus]